MTIPKSILKSTHDNIHLIPKHVNFESISENDAESIHD